MSNRRSLSLAVGASLAIGPFSAHAIIVDGVEIGPVASSFVWTSDTAVYQDYAQGCGSSGCGTTGTVTTIGANEDILFFWGVDGQSTNSRTQWTFDNSTAVWAQPLNLQYVALRSTGQSGTLGTEYTSDGANPLGPRLIGTGLTGTWPVDNGTGGFQGNEFSFETLISNARITILANGAAVGATARAVETSRPTNAPLDPGDYFQVDIDQGQSQPADPTTPWVMRAQGPLDGDQDVVAYVQMPVSEAFRINGTVGTELANGSTVDLRLSELVASNVYTIPGVGAVTGPSAMLADTTVQMVGTYVGSLLGVNNTAPINLGLFRIGDTNTDAQAINATATNTKVSVTRTTVLYDVQFGDAVTGIPSAGQFVRTGLSAGGNLAEGASVSRGYTYEASDFGANTGTVPIGAITGVNADGTAYTGTASNTSQNVTYQATGVGPRFQLTGEGLTGASDTTIDFGSVLITKDEANPQVQNDLVVTNTYVGAGAASLSLTGLTVNSTVKDGANPANFGGSPTATSIAANNGTQAFVATFSASTAGTKTATMRFNTDVGSVLGGTGATFERTLTGTAYVATLSADATPVDLGYARIGGAATTPQAVVVENETGGGYDLTNVTFGPATGATAGASFSGGGTLAVPLADGETGSSAYSVSAEASIGPVASATPLTANVQISSAEAQSVARTLQADAVGPLFDFSGKDVDFTDGDTCSIVGPSGNAVCGTINLGELSPGSTAATLTIANLFDASGLNLSQLGDLADLTLINVGFGPDYDREIAVGTGLFSLSAILSGTELDPEQSGGTSSVAVQLAFASTDEGTDFVTTLRLLTDVNAGLGAQSGGKEFLFDVTASWKNSPAPAPGGLALLALGLAGLGLGRRRDHN